MRKAEFIPVAINVIVSVIVVSIHNVINKAVNGVEYFLFVFKTCPPQQNPGKPGIKAFGKLIRAFAS